MASITLRGNPINTNGELPSVGQPAPDFTLTAGDLSDAELGRRWRKQLLQLEADSAPARRRRRGRSGGSDRTGLEEDDSRSRTRS